MSIEHKNIASADRHEPIGFESAGTDTVYTKGSGWVKAPKGLETATSKQTYVADGAGSGAWQSAMVHGGLTMPIDDATTTNYPITGSGSGGGWVRVSDVTIGTCTATAGSHPEFTSSANGELVYTGTLTRHHHIVCTVSLKLDSGTALETVRSAIYHYDASALTWSKVDHSEVRCSVNGNTTTASVAMHADLMLDTNDKIVLGVYNPTSAKLVVLRSYYLYSMGMTGA